MFHLGISALQYLKMSAISRSEGFGGKMYVPRAMYSFSTSFWIVPVNRPAPTPCSSATSLTTDRVDRLADAATIAVRARRIAVQSALGGMPMSLAAMAAAYGLLLPAAGALLQEGIDVAVILNALRALRVDRTAQVAIEPATEQLIQRFAAEHDDLRDVIEAIRETADQLRDGAAHRTPSGRRHQGLRLAASDRTDQAAGPVRRRRGGKQRGPPMGLPSR